MTGTSRSQSWPRTAARPAPGPGRLLACTALLAVLLTGAIRGGASTESVNGQIAYTVQGPGLDEFTPQSDIWVMNGDGTGAVNLTDTPDTDEESPVWSPDGTRIAFLQGGTSSRLAIIDRDGGGRVVLTPEPSFQFSPTWSPGGTQIAVVRQVPGEVMALQFDIIVISVDGSGETNVTKSDSDELDPAWSPDGDRIAFAAVRPERATDPITGESVPSAQWEIVTVYPDGTGEQVLSGGDPGTPRAERLEEDRAPAWSPDGRMLVFMSQSVDPCCDRWKIAAVNRDGSGLSVLSEDPESYDMSPSWSPDGTEIVFASDRDAVSGGEFDLYRMPAPASLPSLAPARPAAKGPVTRLTANGRAGRPSWGGRRPLPPTLSLFVLSEAEEGARGRVRVLTRGLRTGNRRMHSYAAGSAVELAAVPRKRSSFAGWFGAINESARRCRLTMDDVMLVTARFVRIP